MLNVFVDADACPVKQEVYRVAARYHISVTLVANSWMRVPAEDGIVLHVVGNGRDEVDNWIVATVTPDDIVITADILLASRCIKAGAHAIGTTGKAFTEDRSRHMKKTKVTKVKPVRPRLREDLKDPTFRAQYMEKQRMNKLAVKLATEREIKKV